MWHNMLVRLRCRFEMMSTSRFYFSFRHEKQHTAAEVVVMLFFFFVWKAVYRQALLSLPQFVEKVCIYKNRANSLSLSPNPFPMGRGYITGATAPSPCRGLRPCDPIFKKYRFIDSLIYLIQRPCLFLVLPAFTQDIRKKHSCSE